MKKKACAECGGKLRTRTGAIEVDVAGHKVKDPSLPVDVCDKCGAYVLSQEELEESERRAALVVLSDIAAPSGKVLRFARKAVGLRQVDLARALSTNPETVSRWESLDHIDRQLSLAVAHLLTLYSERPEQFDLLIQAEPEPEPEPLPARKRKIG